MDSIIDLLKKIFTASVIGNVIAFMTFAITFIFGLSQYLRDNSLEVCPLVNNTEIKADTINNVIITTNDTVKLIGSTVFPTFKNTSKYAINNLIVEYRVISSSHSKGHFIYTYNNNFKYYSFKTRKTSPKYLSNDGTFWVNSYKTKLGSLYPNESTPDFLKGATLLPLSDVNNCHSFVVEINLSWEGEKNRRFISKYSILGVDDNSYFSSNWVKKAKEIFKDKIKTTNNNLYLAYHTTDIQNVDSGLVRKHFLSSYYNIDSNNIDKITDWIVFDEKFRLHHDFSYEIPNYYIEYDILTTVFGFIFFALFIASIVNCINDLIVHKDVNIGSLIYLFSTAIISYTSLSRWCVNLKLISPQIYNYSQNFTSWSVIISIIYTVIVIFPLVSSIIDYTKKEKDNSEDNLAIPIIGFTVIFILLIALSIVSYNNMNYIDSHLIEVY